MVISPLFIIFKSRRCASSFSHLSTVSQKLLWNELKVFKVRKCHPDMQFLHNCRSSVFYPKFIRWKNIPTKNKWCQNVFYAHLLSDEIKEKHQKRKDLNKELLNCLNNLQFYGMDVQIFKNSVNCYVNKQMTKLKEKTRRN